MDDLDIDFDVKSPLESQKEELVKRQKQESRKLLAASTKWKKQATKHDKKAVNKMVNDLQVKLSTKHKQELELFKDAPQNDPYEEESQSETPDELTPEMLMLLTMQEPEINAEEKSPPPNSGGSGGKKKNRQKERLARRKAEIDRMKLDAQEEAKDMVDYRTLEITSINHILDTRNLVVKDILPDGNCLFNSIKHQLSIRHDKHVEVSELRAMAAKYILDHPDEFMPFLYENNEQELSLEDYCHKLTTTTLWGSDLEVLAYLKLYDCPIEVILTDANHLVFNESGPNPKLYLAYYKHSYGLGQHYNSLTDAA